MSVWQNKTTKRTFSFSVDLSATGSGSDDENISPSWHNETTMTISATPEKIKKRQLRKTKSVKKTLIQEDEEEEDDEETKAYKRRLRNVKNLFFQKFTIYFIYIATT